MSGSIFDRRILLRVNAILLSRVAATLYLIHVDVSRATPALDKAPQSIAGPADLAEYRESLRVVK
jgi:hypothetical protein